MSLTLNQLAQSLNAIIESNKARGWSDRNDLPAAIEIESRTLKGSYRPSKFYTMDYASGAMHHVGEHKFCGVITAREKNNRVVWTNKEKSGKL